MAIDHDMVGLANIIILGKAIKETGFMPIEAAKKAIEKSVPAKRAAMVEKNLKALMLGYNF
jgi:2-oxoglutarate ferredoxin oxidoreductase subunit gamma